ncbi:MAG: nucleotidyltransferase domain-containing protein [Candidatus Eremiobacteraeota bacterium]|nr:nucleotidyltransferase domain-containing protein [Candidatus Eremiobacteraeota bacterium]
MDNRKLDLNKKLKDFIDLLLETIRVEAVVLYGSYAHGNPRLYSDIDIAVFSPDFGGNPIEETTFLFKLRRKIDTDLEPLAYSSNDFYDYTPADFVHEIIENGKIIYKDGKYLI